MDLLVDLYRRMPAAPSEDVEWIPIEPAQPGQSGLPPLHLAYAALMTIVQRVV